MKKSILCAVTALGVLTSLQATEYTFGNFDVALYDQASLPLNGVFGLELGKFTGGFVPSAANLTDWTLHWVSSSSGYYDSSGPEWSVNLALADNTTFAIGDQLFLWAFDTQAGIGSQWALYTDPNWLIAANDGLDPTTYFLEFAASTSAVYGSLNLATFSAGAKTVVASVPDSGIATGLTIAANVLLLAILRRRLAPAV